MNYPAYLAFLLTVLLTGAGPPSPAAGSTPPKDEEAVRRYVLEFADKWAQSLEPAEIAAFYSIDATHINPQGELVRSRESLVEYFQPLVAQRTSSFSAKFDIEAVYFIRPDVALVDGSIEIRSMRGPDGNEIPGLIERFTFVLENGDGAWSIAASRVMFPDTQ